MSTISFETTLFTIGKTTVLRLPVNASAQLPSRGMVLVEGTLNGAHFLTALEPDGKGGHWLNVSNHLLKAAHSVSGDNVTVTMSPSKDWPEPDIPSDLENALADNPRFRELWLDTTPMARWDWIRWIRATNNPDTRADHIVIAYSKLMNGTRRPCCFNRSMCTDFSVSKNGVLLEPEHTKGNV